MPWSVITGVGSMYHGLGAGQKAYAEYSSCRLGRRKQSVRGARSRASAGRLVDPDAALRAAQAVLMQQYYAASMSQMYPGIKALYGSPHTPSHVTVKTSPTTWEQIAQYFWK